MRLRQAGLDQRVSAVSPPPSLLALARCSRIKRRQVHDQGAEITHRTKHTLLVCARTRTGSCCTRHALVVDTTQQVVDRCLEQQTISRVLRMDQRNSKVTVATKGAI